MGLFGESQANRARRKDLAWDLVLTARISATAGERDQAEAHFQEAMEVGRDMSPYAEALMHTTVAEGYVMSQDETHLIDASIHLAWTYAIAEHADKLSEKNRAKIRKLADDLDEKVHQARFPEAQPEGTATIAPPELAALSIASVVNGDSMIVSANSRRTRVLRRLRLLPEIVELPINNIPGGAEASVVQIAEAQPNLGAAQA
jgi:hypothetical protein